MKDSRVLALGFFDGIHLGHSTLLRSAAELAAELDTQSAVMTFDVHPDTLVRGGDMVFINSVSDRVTLIRRLSGIENVIFFPFNRETMQIPWRDFLDALTAKHHVAGYVVGYDFRFGHRGAGSARLLEDYCREHDLACRVIPAVCMDGEVVSSTRIRCLLEDGQLESAVRLLGHEHLLSGQVKEDCLSFPPGVIPLQPGRYRAKLLSPAAQSPEEIVADVNESGHVRLPQSLAGYAELGFTGRV